MDERRKAERRTVQAVTQYGDDWVIGGADRRKMESERREANVMAMWAGLSHADRNRLTLAQARRHDDCRRRN